jgi:hypothetical protein
MSIMKARRTAVRIQGNSRSGGTNILKQFYERFFVKNQVFAAFTKVSTKLRVRS